MNPRSESNSSRNNLDSKNSGVFSSNASSDLDSKGSSEISASHARNPASSPKSKPYKKPNAVAAPIQMTIDKKLKNFEIDIFLEAILQRYGYDFSEYARASLLRRIENRLTKSGFTHISEMVPKILYDDAFFEQFLNDMSITVTGMFRNPLVFKSIREQVIPKLRTYSRINIWHAGCATGEEVYSMAIILEEEGLLDRSRIYATDYNKKSLELAKKGIYPTDMMKQYTKNYLQAGGKHSFSDYYQANYDSVKIKESLKEKITFAHHNLMQDRAFAEMHLVLCRNVLIYFGKPLQNRVLNILRDSLVQKGFLVLGDKETIAYTEIEDDFSEFDARLRLFRKNTLYDPQL